MKAAKKHFHTAMLANAAVIDTPLGWISMTEYDGQLTGVSIGHRIKKQAIGALQIKPEMLHQTSELLEMLIDRLLRYCDEEPVDFSDIKVDDSHLTPFARKVSRNCQRIGYGQTLTYGQLAKCSGSPAAARAVGSVMAKNRFPLVVPCHRVVAADRKLGGFSAPGGGQTKLRLLRLENHNVCCELA